MFARCGALFIQLCIMLRRALDHLGRADRVIAVSRFTTLRDAEDWASADVADTVRKVAATAINVRSNPPRLFQLSRIVTPPWAKLSRH